MRAFKQGEHFGSNHKHDRNSDKGRTKSTRPLCQSKIRQTVGSYILGIWDE